VLELAVFAAAHADPKWGRLAFEKPSAFLAPAGLTSTAEREERVLGLAVCAAAEANRECGQLPHTFILRMSTSSLFAGGGK